MYYCEGRLIVKLHKGGGEPELREMTGHVEGYRMLAY